MMKRLSRLLTTTIISAVSIQCLGGIPVHAAAGVAVTAKNFPDANFRSVIANTYDRDGDGYLSDYEISTTMNIVCEGKGISSIKGIEFFTDIQGLWCADNNISEWDLSNNKDLRGIWCSGNDFTSLDFTDNPNLEWVYCFDCKLKSINVSNNHDLAYLEINTNPLEGLDVTNNENLEHLMCGSCGLKSLDLSGNPNLCHLDAFNNDLRSLDFSNNTKLKRLDIWENQNLGNVDISDLKELQYYNCSYNGVTRLDVSNNPELQKLSCAYNSIHSLDLSSNPKLAYLDCAINPISTLDLSNNPRIYFLQAFTNDFTTLDISNNSRLIKVYNDGYYQDEYDVCDGHSWSIQYGVNPVPETGDELLYFLCVDDTVKVNAKPSGKADVYDSYIDTDDGLSDSDDLITRGMAIETLYKLAGSPSVRGLKTRFTDVPSGASYADAVKWGEDNLICLGYPNVCSDTFCADEYITREDLALMMHRYASYAGYKTAFDYGRTDWFDGYFDIDYYCWGAFTWAIQWEYLEPDGTQLYPHGRVTRSDYKNAITILFEDNYEDVPDVIPIPDAPDIEYGWIQDSKGWRYRDTDGSFVTSGWKKIDGVWYYFKDNGYMATGWILDGGTWYYLGGSGDMKTGWQKVGNRWYYLGTNGAMETEWGKIDGKWYYFGSDGSMKTGWQKVNGIWYYLYSDGTMATGWVKSGGDWYYMLDYGAMKTGWLYSGGKWYYFYPSSGKMAYNTTIEGYKLGPDGAML